MKVQYRSQKQVSTEYINLCFECEIPIKEAVKFGYSLQDLKRQVYLNDQDLRYSINANCD